jgi:membrane protein
MTAKYANTGRISHPRAIRRMVDQPRVFFYLLKETFINWRTDNAQRMAAALAYYTIFAIAPTLVITIALADLFVEREQAEQRLLYEVKALIGNDGATLIESMLGQPLTEQGNIIATIVGLITITFAVGGAFGQLQSAFNNIWGVQIRPNCNVWQVIRTRVFSFAAIIAGLAYVGEWIQNRLPETHFVLSAVNFSISFVVITLLFAVLYKVLPDVNVPWSDVWIGSIVTSILFNIGKWAIGLYLGNSDTANIFGAAAALVVLLLWVNYSAQIVLFGAEFTQTYATWRGAVIRPAAHAMFIEWTPIETTELPEKHAPEEAAQVSNDPTDADEPNEHQPNESANRQTINSTANQPAPPTEPQNQPAHHAA